MTNKIDALTIDRLSEIVQSSKHIASMQAQVMLQGAPAPLVCKLLMHVYSMAWADAIWALHAPEKFPKLVEIYREHYSIWQDAIDLAGHGINRPRNVEPEGSNNAHQLADEQGSTGCGSAGQESGSDDPEEKG